MIKGAVRDVVSLIVLDGCSSFAEPAQVTVDVCHAASSLDDLLHPLCHLFAHDVRALAEAMLPPLLLLAQILSASTGKCQSMWQKVRLAWTGHVLST